MRQIFVVNATQVVISDNHPEGAYSTLPDFPKTFDSRSYNATQANPDGDVDKAARMARAEFYKQQSDLLRADNRTMWTVTIERADGKQILPPATLGSFPDMTPQPEPVAE